MADPGSATTQPPVAAGDVQDGLPTPRRHWATLAIMATLVLVVLDGAIANVALPTIATSLDVSPAASVWVVNSYQLSLVMALLPCAALGESLGLRRVFIRGVAVFTGASLLCSLSPSLPWLVAARFVQGLGGAAVVALGIGLIRFTYPQRLLGAVIGWNATMIALSAAAGPTIGSAILAVSNWPWLFAVNLPVGAVVLVAALALPQPPGTGRKLDLASAALNATAFASLVLGADRAASAPRLAAGLLAVSAASFVALVRREMPRQAPAVRKASAARVDGLLRHVARALPPSVSDQAGVVAATLVGSLQLARAIGDTARGKALLASARQALLAQYDRS